MANLRANKITSTEVFETTGSVQFDGSGDYLEIPNSSDLEFGNNSFTIEAWLYPVASGGSIFNIFYNKGVGLQCYWKSNTNKIEVYADSNNTSNYDILNSLNTPSGSIISGQWAHIAIVRNINVFQIYLNGIASGSSITNSASIGSNSNGVTIGDYKPNLSNYEFNGHISNLRILKGTALYTKNFTPPTRELTVIPNTVLLACTSTTNTAQEATGKTITVNGNAVANELTPGLLTDRVKSGGSSAISGSVEFDGTGDYITLPSSNDLDFGTGDFTIECWAYFNSTTNTNNKGSAIITNPSGSITTLYTSISGGNTLTFYNGSSIVSSTFDIKSWNHIAVTRIGTTVSIFINGILRQSETHSSSVSFNSGNIGSQTTTAGYFNGFLSNLRLIKGQALYTGSFIPPSRELKKIPNTVLLCCKNSSDPTAEETGKTITANGDPAASNFTPSVGFDGTVTFDGVTKINTQNYFYLPTGNTEDRGRGRGVFTISSGTPANSNAINYLQISSSGNSIDFGDLTSVSESAGSVSSSTRMIIALGGNSPVTASPGNVNTLDYLTIATTSNTLDFGDLTTKRGEIPGVSNSTRGVFIGGVTELVSPYSGPTINYTNTMDYISIASLGNALDFGDSHSDKSSHNSAVGNNTRGVYTVSWNGSTTVNNINYITISTTGNGQDFGDLITPQNRQQKGSVSNSTRGLFAGGISPVSVNTIEYITITSLGNAQDFGDLSYARRNAGGTSNSIRGVFAGGYDAPPGPLGRTNVIDYVILASTGNASDFGDLLEKSLNNTGASDSHGGLS